MVVFYRRYGLANANERRRTDASFDPSRPWKRTTQRPGGFGSARDSVYLRYVSGEENVTSKRVFVQRPMATTVIITLLLCSPSEVTRCVCYQMQDHAGAASLPADTCIVYASNETITLACHPIRMIYVQYIIITCTAVHVYVYT